MPVISLPAEYVADDVFVDLDAVMNGTEIRISKV